MPNLSRQEVGRIVVELFAVAPVQIPTRTGSFIPRLANRLKDGTCIPLLEIFDVIEVLMAI